MNAPPRALVVHVATLSRASDDDARSLSSALSEAVGLASAIALDVAEAHIVKLRQKTPATLIGKGKIEELAERIETLEITVVILDCQLSPLQQRNLEKALNCKVIDRTALILEIFGARARTAEGKLQVELASLTYQKSRLVRSWTHLERQRGGFGFLGGPGESQIELDRRLISERIIKIKKQLEKVVRTRNLHRSVRRDVPYPLVAIVGYTNAGKSTLFNKLTGSDVMAKDMLFATLDPTIRALTLPTGEKIMLSDTVGFISNLPTELIAAFRATLEEVLEADIILHVRDISDPDTSAQKRDVLAVLKGLFGDESYQQHLMEVHNKIDLLPENEGEIAPLANEQIYPVIRTSAVTGEGLDVLCNNIAHTLNSHQMHETTLRLPASAGKAMAWLHAHGNVLRSKSEADGTQTITVRLSTAHHKKFQEVFGKF